MATTDHTHRLTLSELESHLWASADFERPDLLGAAYEYLIKQFADSAGKKGNASTCGSGDMLIQSKHYIGDSPDISLHGQEMNLSTWAICKMNMFLHGVRNASIADPKHTRGGELLTFDRVIANPPFSLKNWGVEYAESDPYDVKAILAGGIPKTEVTSDYVQETLRSLRRTRRGRLRVQTVHCEPRGDQAGARRSRTGRGRALRAMVGQVQGHSPRYRPAMPGRRRQDEGLSGGARL